MPVCAVASFGGYPDTSRLRARFDHRRSRRLSFSCESLAMVLKTGGASNLPAISMRGLGLFYYTELCVLDWRLMMIMMFEVGNKKKKLLLLHCPRHESLP